MRLTYDNLGSGRVTGVGHYVDLDAPGTVDFLDSSSLPTVDRIRRAIAATPGRYTVTGAVGSRQLYDAGASIASEAVEGAATIASVSGLQTALDGKEPSIAIGTFAQALTPTAVKTSAYAAAAGDFVPVDTTSGAVTVTLPTAPADKTRVAVKHVIQGGTNTVTYACGGSDVLNKTGGVASGTLTLAAQAVLLQYKASGAIWYVQADDMPLSQLDLRFQATIPTGTFAKPAIASILSARAAATVVGQRSWVTDVGGGTLYEALDGSTWTQITIGLTAPILKSVVTTKGDLLAATASGTVARVAVGANTQYLQADSSAAGGVSWADLPAAGGSISGQLTASSSSQHSITGNNTGNALNLRNLNAAGYPATLLQDNAGTAVGVYGYGNGSVAVTALRSSMFFASLVASTTVPGAVRVGQWLNNGVDFRTRLIFDTDGSWSLYKLDGTSKVLTYDPTAGYVVLMGSVTGKNAGQLRNTHVSGYSTLEVLDSAAALVGTLGYANASATFAPGVLYLGSNSATSTPTEFRITQFLSGGGTNRTRLKLATTGDLELYHSDGTTKLVSLVSVAPVAGSIGDLNARPSVSLGAIMALSGWNRAANGTAHIIQANGNVENTLAVQSISTGNETYSAIALLDEVGEAKFTYGFGNFSSLVWKRRAYLEAWCGQHSSTETPDIITVQSSGFPNLSFVRMRHIGCAPGGSPGDTVFYRSVAWPADTEPANSRAMTIYTDGSGIELNKVAAAYMAASPDGTRYKLTPSNGGGAATWVAA